MLQIVLVISIVFNGILLADDKIQIVANKFFSNINTGYAELEGNVSINRDKDSLQSNSVLIYFDKKKKPKKFIAKGDVHFTFVFKDRMFVGKANNALYNAQDNSYVLKGNVSIKEEGKTNKIFGKEIHINANTGQLDIQGNDLRPVKMVFTIDKNTTSDFK